MYSEVVFCIKLFKILSVSNFESFMSDLGYNGVSDYELREIARDFLRKILPLDGRNIILSKPYIRNNISESDVLEAWLEVFTKLEQLDRASDICTWFSRVKHQWNNRDNRLDIVTASWNLVLNDWCLKPEKYPELPFEETSIQKLRIEMLLYRIKLAEIEPRMKIAIRSDYIDKWDEVLANNKVIHNWLLNTARLNYAIEKWASIFTVLSQRELQRLEIVWDKIFKEEHNSRTYFSLLELRDYCKSNAYI